TIAAPKSSAIPTLSLHDALPICDFLEGLSREAFRIAHDISSYSFPAMAKAAMPHLRKGSALLTLTYLGALRSLPNYNTMGLAKRSEEHTSELQSRFDLVCRLLLE